MLIKNLELSKCRPSVLDNVYNKCVSEESLIFSRVNFPPFSFLNNRDCSYRSQFTRCLGSRTLALGPKAQRNTSERGEDWT